VWYSVQMERNFAIGESLKLSETDRYKWKAWKESEKGFIVLGTNPQTFSLNGRLIASVKDENEIVIESVYDKYSIVLTMKYLIINNHLFIFFLFCESFLYFIFLFSMFPYCSYTYWYY